MQAATPSKLVSADMCTRSAATHHAYPRLRLRRFPAWAKQNMQSSIASPLAFSCSWPPYPQHLSTHMQVDKILGKGAPPEFIEEVRELCLRHHCDLEVDVIR